MENIILKKDLHKTKIIGITGFAHVGKDTLALFIRENIKQNVRIEPFAKPIKDMLIEHFGFTEEQMYNQDLKEQIDLFWEITPRKLMQLVGTEMFRKNFRYDVWVKVLEKKFVNDNNSVFIVPDIRFDNEAELILKYNGIVIKVNREQERISTSSHDSEKGINDNLVTCEINNNGTLEDLKNISKIISEIII